MIDRDPPVRRVTDANGHSWRIGTDAEVAWIAEGTSPNLTITAAIPPVFEAYATVVLPDNGEDQERHNRAIARDAGRGVTRDAGAALVAWVSQRE